MSHIGQIENTSFLKILKHKIDPQIRDLLTLEELFSVTLPRPLVLGQSERVFWLSQ